MLRRAELGVRRFPINGNAQTYSLGPLGTLYPSVTGPWKQDADDLLLSDMTPKATYQPSDEINQAIKGATLAWATAKDEKEGTETPAGGDDRSASR